MQNLFIVLSLGVSGCPKYPAAHDSQRAPKYPGLQLHDILSPFELTSQLVAKLFSTKIKFSLVDYFKFTELKFE